ncbi:MAG TPA: hypothetical protein VJ927_05185 [Actinomycetota bacterium]|nr:hypothetical protein [Actinomycetota bacterium]
MSPVAKSAAAFAVYLSGMGLALLAIPGNFRDLIGLPPADDLYLRLVGAIAIALGIYYAAAARDENVPFLRSTVPARVWVLVAFTSIALLSGEPILILFGLADAAFAAWTWNALRAADRIVAT